jgi:hypothetical protein
MEIETKDKIKELINQAETDSSGRWISAIALEAYTKKVINECITAVENTPKHCAYTTFQESIVDCTVEMSVQSIKQHFNL